MEKKKCSLKLQATVVVHLWLMLHLSFHTAYVVICSVGEIDSKMVFWNLKQLFEMVNIFVCELYNKPNGNGLLHISG